MEPFMNDETKALVEKSFREVLEQHLQGFEAHIQGQVAEAVRMLKERQEAENIFLWAYFDALTLVASENAGMHHDSMAAILRENSKTFLESRLTKLEDTHPEFAARVQAWADGNFPSFPFGEPLPLPQ
jgi:hypothetical protein